MPEPTIYLVRHGQTALNAEGRLRGRLDPPLDDVGQRQVEELGAAFAALPDRPGRVIAGPLLRTQQTAQAIAAVCGLDVLTDERLTDRDYGPWTGQPGAEVRARYGAGLLDLPDAEPVDDVVARSSAVLADELPYLDAPVVLVSHDAVNTNLLAHLSPDLGPAHTITQETACWNRLDRAEHGWRVVVVNGDADALRRVPRRPR